MLHDQMRAVNEMAIQNPPFCLVPQTDLLRQRHGANPNGKSSVTRAFVYQSSHLSSFLPVADPEPPLFFIALVPMPEGFDF